MCSGYSLREGECCDLEFLRDRASGSDHGPSNPAAAPLLALLPSGRRLERRRVADRVYLIDPLGNLMMSYAPDANPKGMLEDLKRLLRLSHVG